MWGLPSFALGVLLLLPAAAAAHPKMLLVGDSITAGVGAEDPATQGYVALFAERFPELRIANLGCSGSTTRDWTIDGASGFCALGNAWPLLAVPELPAQITHILLGTNDAYGFFEWFPDGRHGDWLTAAEYEERLRLLIERSPGLVFVSTPPPLAYTITGPVTERLRAYRDVVLSVVDDYKSVELGVDFHELLDRHTEVVGCHPNTEGHAVMADALEESVLSQVPMRALARYKHSKRFTRETTPPQRGGKHIVGAPERSRKAPIPFFAIEDVGSPCETFPQGD